MQSQRWSSKRVYKVRDFYSDEEMPNNYKKDNKNDLDEDSDEEVKNTNSLCCGLCTGVKFIFSKFIGITSNNSSENYISCIIQRIMNSEIRNKIHRRKYKETKYFRF